MRIAFADDAQSQLIAEYRNNLAGITGLRARLTVILRTLMAFDAEHPGMLHVAFLDPLTIAPEDGDARRIYDRLGDFLYLILGDQEIVGDDGVDGFDRALISHALCGFVGNALMYVVRRDMAGEAMIENVVGFVERALVSAVQPGELQRTAAT